MNEVLTRDGAQMQHLIRDLRGVGIEIPVDLESELNLYRSVQDTDRVARIALQDAQSNLSSCSPDEWDDAVAALSTALTSSWNLNNGLTSNLLQTATDRLVRTTYHYTSHWSAEIVLKLNALVESTEWNRHVRNIPTFDRKVRVLSITRSQATAVAACREAVDAFNPLWKVLVQLGNLDGHEIGVGRAEDFSRNAHLFYVLSDGDWSQAQSAAVAMAGAAFGSDTASEYAELLPFVFPGLVGADLNFATPSRASERRRNRQTYGGLSHVPQYSGVSYS